MTDHPPTMDTVEHPSGHGHVVHRIAHAIYGLIILTTVVGELRAHDEDMRTAVLLVGAGAVALVFAHTYSQFVAVFATSAGRPRRERLVPNIVDQLALAIPATAAVLVFLLAEGDVITDRVAYGVVLGGSLAALFGLGAAAGIHRRRGIVWSVALGAVNTVVGVVIIGIEAAAAH